MGWPNHGHLGPRVKAAEQAWRAAETGRQGLCGLRAQDAGGRSQASRRRVECGSARADGAAPKTPSARRGKAFADPPGPGVDEAGRFTLGIILI